MKKIISLLLAFCMITSLGSTLALAEDDDTGGFGYNTETVIDNLEDRPCPVYNKDYTVAYNDFESVQNYVNASFPIEDCGDSDYGMAFTVKANPSWAAVLNRTEKYSWGDKELTLFNEPLEIGQNYILSYDYLSDKNSVGTSSNCFSLAPQHTQFWMDNDYRNYPMNYKDGLWHTNKFAFTAEKATTAVKINTCGYNIKSYIDNYLIVKAATVSFTDSTGSTTIEDLGNTMVSGAKSYSGIDMVQMGISASFKVSTTTGFKIRSVKMGDTTIEPETDGSYKIAKVTDNIVIESALDDEILAKNYFVKDNDIYLNYGETLLNVAKTADITNKILAATDTANKACYFDDALTKDSKVQLVSNGTVYADYSVKVIGDYNNDGNITVTDVVNGVSSVISDSINSSDIGKYDLDKNGTINVTDIVRTREVILGMDTNTYAPESSITALMDTYVSDVIAASGVNITTDDLANGIYNNGNRTRIANVMRKAMRGENITICCFGGSITAGAGSTVPVPDGSGITSTFSGNTNNYCDWVCKWWQQMFSNVTITKVNAGIGATDSVLATHRMERDVLAYNPDLVVTEWCVNDGTAYAYKQGTYESMVRKFLDSGVALLIFSMCGGAGNTSQSVHEPISDLYDVPMISYKNAYFTNEKFTNFSSDGTHPNIVGHPLAALTLNYFFQTIYEDIDRIGFMDSAMPDTMVNADADLYDGGYIASLDDINNGKCDGITMKSLGSFTVDTAKTTFGTCSYYGMTANYAASYEPMVIEIKNCKTLFIQMLRTKLVDGSFRVEVNGKSITDDTLTCSNGSKDNSQIEMTYHWATSRIYGTRTPTDVTLKIYPTNQRSDEYVRLLTLLVS